MSQLSGCCPSCFKDEFLIEVITKNGEFGYCDYCKKNSDYCIDPQTLKPFFEPLINLYVPVADVLTHEELKEYDGDVLFEKLNEDWGTFSWECKNTDALLKDIFEKDFEPGIRDSIFDEWVERADKYWDYENYAKIKMIKSWRNFRKGILHKNRYFSKRLKIENLFPLVTIDFPEKQIDLLKEQFLYRARVSAPEKLRPSKMGKPPAKISRQGRCNPEGISYLYVASDAETAVSEVKPYVGEYITIGKFEIQKTLRIIDLRNPSIESPFKHVKNLKTTLDQFAILRMLGRDLSIPINPNKSSLEYLPTQYLCELIKDNKYDGLAYKSSLSNGFNLALFSSSSLKCIETKLIKVEKIKIDTTPISDDSLDFPYQG